MKPCCSEMQSMRGREGGDGFSVKLKEGVTSPFHVLEFRSYPLSGAETYSEFFRNNPHTPKLKVGSETVLVFCPWCGHDLRRDILELEFRNRGFIWTLKKWLGFPVSVSDRE